MSAVNEKLSMRTRDTYACAACSEHLENLKGQASDIALALGTRMPVMRAANTMSICWGELQNLNWLQNAKQSSWCLENSCLIDVHCYVM